MSALSRRRFLELLGAGAIALPAALTFRQQAARAAIDPRPARMLILYTPHGAPAEYFWPQSASNLQSQDGAVSILGPLQRHASKLNVLRGIDYVGSNNHGANRDVLTAKTPDSLDTVVARGLGVQPLRLGVIPDYANSFTVDGYLAFDGGAPQQHNPDPTAVFDELVGALPPAGDPPPAPATASTARLRQLALQPTEAEIDELRQRVRASSMRDRVQAHLAAVSELRAESTDTQPVEGCSQATLASVEALRGKNVWAAENFDAVFAAQLDLAELALRCRLTRVVSIQAGYVNHGIPFTWIGEQDGHHQLSHNSPGAPGRIGHARCQHYFAEKLAALLDRLDSPDPEDPAHTILDNTTVLWITEIADGQLHNCESVPIVLAGGGAGCLRTGQYLQLGARSHAELLIALCKAMGVDGASFGPGLAPLAEVLV